MIVDRIFGLIAVIAFALGIVCQAELLLSTKQRDPFEPLFVTLFALTVVVYGYATLRAERREGLIDPADESLDLVEVAFSLPRWVIASSALFLAYIAVICVGARSAHLLAQWPNDALFLRQSLKENGIFAIFAGLAMLTSFIIAAFFLIRAPVKELR